MQRAVIAPPRCCYPPLSFKELGFNADYCEVSLKCSPVFKGEQVYNYLRVFEVQTKK